MAYLFYLMGPSGSGKDSIIRGVRERMNDHKLLVAHRYITRHWQAGGENHIELSEREFDHRVEFGLLSLHWQANGCRYGIGAEVEHWLDRGFAVLINGSRGHVQEARSRFGDRFVPVLVTVDPDLLHRRLIDRGREDAQAIEERVARSRQLQQSTGRDERVIELPNNGSLEQAVERLGMLIETYPQAYPEGMTGV